MDSYIKRGNLALLTKGIEIFKSSTTGYVAQIADEDLQIYCMKNYKGRSLCQFHHINNDMINITTRTSCFIQYRFPLINYI